MATDDHATENAPDTPSPELRAEAPTDAASRDKAPESEPMGRRYLAPLIAGTALLVFAAAVWFSYSLGTRSRDNTVVPVIQADASAVKRRPDKPGGIDPPHQDKLVFDRVAPGQSGEIAERLRPAPEEPLEEAKTIPPEEQEPAAGSPSAETAEAPGDESASAPLGPPPVWSEARMPDQSPIAKKLAEPAADKPAATAADKPTPETPQQPAAKAPEPAQMATAPVGSFRVQIASLRSEDGAKKAWKRLLSAYADLLQPTKPFIEKADLGGERGTYYRLQVGPFPDKPAAAALCAALRKRAASCIVVKGG